MGMPMLLAATADVSYVRVHRRHGTTDRRLSDLEQQRWAERLRALLPELPGPCFFLWGTDWEDTPVRNARALDAALGAQWSYDWAAACKAGGAARKSNLLGFFASSSASATGGKKATGGSDTVQSCDEAAAGCPRDEIVGEEKEEEEEDVGRIMMGAAGGDHGRDDDDGGTCTAERRSPSEHSRGGVSGATKRTYSRVEPGSRPKQRLGKKVKGQASVASFFTAGSTKQASYD